MTLIPLPAFNAIQLCDGDYSFDLITSSHMVAKQRAIGWFDRSFPRFY
ncbi:hypothetical protein GAMM_120080 [Gammaproteobacteria bacterium]